MQTLLLMVGLDTVHKLLILPHIPPYFTLLQSKQTNKQKPQTNKQKTPNNKKNNISIADSLY